MHTVTMTGHSTNGSVIYARLTTVAVASPHTYDFNYTTVTTPGSSDIALSSAAINENAGANATVGTLSTTGGTSPCTPTTW